MKKIITFLSIFFLTLSFITFESLSAESFLPKTKAVPEIFSIRPNPAKLVRGKGWVCVTVTGRNLHPVRKAQVLLNGIPTNAIECRLNRLWPQTKKIYFRALPHARSGNRYRYQLRLLGDRDKILMNVPLSKFHILVTDPKRSAT